MMNPGDTLLDGRYRIEKLLGSGSQGHVYLAKHQTLQISRAVKVIDHQHLSARAFKEADILKGLRHPAIPLIYDVEVTPQCVVIIEEPVEGTSLHSLIFPKHTISYREVIRYGLQLCEVVGYLHVHGICHHDIKPENILIDQGVLKLLDYGSAVSLTEPETEPLNGHVLHYGTRGFAAPEQYQNAEAGRAADIYSVGVVLLMMATGNRSRAALDEVQPKELQRVIAKCLSHAPKERYSSVEKLAAALRALDKNPTVPGILHIHFAGVLPHCGTTHCAVAAARALQKERLRPLLIEQNESDAFRQILRASNRMSFCDGIFRAEGLSWIPEYGGAVEPAISPTYNRFLYDDGVVSEANQEAILSGDLVCLVCGASPQELEALDRFLQKDILRIKDRSERFRLLINFASAKRYKQIARRYPGIEPIRVPYAPLE